MAERIPLVTVITPYRNAECWLAGLVETLKNQTYGHWECLLVDHWSVDAGPDRLKDLVADDARFRCLVVPVQRDQHLLPEGPALPRNLALKHAAGELICFLDVDDLWHPCKLERQVQMHLTQRLDLSVTAYFRWSWSTPDQMQWHCPPRRLSTWKWRWGNPIPMLTVMLSRGLLQTLQLQTDALFEPVHHEDYLFWLRLADCAPNLRYGCVPEGLAIHRRFQSNLTAQRWRMPIWTLGVFRRVGWPTWIRWLSFVVWTIAHSARLCQERLGWGSSRLSLEKILHSPPYGPKSLS